MVALVVAIVVFEELKKGMIMVLAISNIPVLSGMLAERFIRSADDDVHRRGRVDFARAMRYLHAKSRWLMFIGIVMASGFSHVRGDSDPVDHIWVPHPISMTITGEAKSDTGKTFLVAGSNAVARIELDEFKPRHEWQEYRSEEDYAHYSEVYSGKFRHILRQIIIIGYAARSPFYDFIHDDYLTAATKDITFTYFLSKESETSDFYTIDFIKSSGSTTAIPEEKLRVETGKDGVFELPMVFPTGEGFHGAYYWTAKVLYEEEGTQVRTCYFKDLSEPVVLGEYEFSSYYHGKLYLEEGEPDGVLIYDESGWVFFDKYGQDHAGVPNWFRYWREDGACPSLDKYKDKIVLTDGEPGLYGYWNSDSRKIFVPRDPSFKAGVDFSGTSAFHYPYGVTAVNTNYPSMKYTFGGSKIYGIYTVEEVICHELFHETIYDLYESNYNSWVGRWFGIRPFDSDRRRETYKWPVVVDDGTTCAVEIKERPWCDSLCDFEEEAWACFKLDKNNTDTYQLATCKNQEYGAYGDSEFLCMIQGNVATSRTPAEGGADPARDWAFPGAQSWLPTVPPRDDEAGNRSKQISSLRSVNAGSSLQPSFGIGHLTKNMERDTGVISTVSYSLEVRSSGVDELRMTGVLTDMNGCVAAYAQASAFAGTPSAVFCFDAEEIYESGLEGPFQLDCIRIFEADGNDVYERALLSDFKDATINVVRSELARKDAYLLDVVGETVTTNGIEVSINVEVNTAGTYELVETLATTSGVLVASGNVVVNCGQGTNSVNVVFAANEIFDVLEDGPYVIDNVALFKDGVRVDSRLDFYTLCKLYKAESFEFDEGTDFVSAEFMAQFEDYTPPAELPPPERFWVFFNPNGGAMLELTREVIGGEKVGTLPVPTLENDEFIGWYTEMEGGTQVYDSTIVTTNVMYHARWKKGGIVVPPQTQQVYTVTFNANGGMVSPVTRTAASGAVIGELPIPTWNGHTFEGWFTAVNGGTLVTASTKITSHITFYAHWSADGGGGSDVDGGGSGTGGGSGDGGDVPKPDPSVQHLLYGGVGGAVPATFASVYDGYLYNGNGNVNGTIQVKVGKPNANTKLAAVKATVIGLDGKKKSLKAVEKGKAKIESDGTTTVELVGGESCTVTLGAKGMSGTYGSYDIDGALNVFSSKDAADKATVSAVLDKWQGVVNVAWRDAGAARPEAAPYHTLSVTIAAKGKAKVAGTLADGTKVTASSQLLVGEEWCCVPVLEPKKAKLAFVMWLPKNGGSAVGTGLANAVVGKPGTLKSGAEFRMDEELGDAKYAKYLPDGLGVTVNGAKWVLPKAGKVQLAKDGSVDEAKAGENPSALKLTCTAKTGVFKGSFKSYSDVNGKPKGVTVNVTGVLVDGVGYGAATIKKVGSVPVTIDKP